MTLYWIIIKKKSFHFWMKLKNKNKDLFFQLLNHFINNYKDHSIRENFSIRRFGLILWNDDCNYLSNFFSFISKYELKTDHDSFNAAKDLTI